MDLLLFGKQNNFTFMNHSHYEPAPLKDSGQEALEDAT